MKVVITSQARLELDRIWTYIDEDNPERAISFVREVGRRCLLLKDMPFRYRLVEGHEETGIRRMPYGNYVVFYRVTKARVDVLHILNAAQDHEQVVFPPEQP